MRDGREQRECLLILRIYRCRNVSQAISEIRVKQWPVFLG